MSINKTNPETKMLVYSTDAINNVLNIIDKTFSVNGINQIMSVSAIVNELTHPFKEMELKDFLAEDEKESVIDDDNN